MPDDKEGTAPKLPASLQDLVSVAFDLEFVERACGRVLAPKTNDDGIENMGLWISAVIVYARCFGSGSRTPLPQSVQDKMTAAELDTHRRIWRKRDKYVAHVEFTREEILAIERIEKSTTREPLGHQIQFKRFTHDPAEVRRLKDLAAGLRGVLGPLLNAETQAFWESCRPRT